MQRYPIITLALLLVSTVLMTAAEPPAPYRVLFIGASTTSRLPALTAFSMAQTGTRIEPSSRMIGGSSLGDHIEAGILEHIAATDYDVIIFAEPRHTEADSENLVQLLEVGRKSEAQMILYSKPISQVTYEDRPERIPGARAVTAERLRDHGLPSLPVDRAFVLALEELEYDALWVEDRVHFTQAGWYLLNCVTHGVLSGRTPVGLPPFVTRDDDVILKIEPALAERLQKCAWQAVKEADQLALAEGRPTSGTFLDRRNRRPRLTLRSPAGEWTVFPSGSAIPVIAHTRTISAPLESVEVLVDETVVDRLASPPYQTVWQPDEDGTHALRLRAIDVDGRHARTDPVRVTVGELPPQPERSTPTLTGFLWRECAVGELVDVELEIEPFETPFASWKLMRGEEVLAACPDSSMQVQWQPDKTGYQDLYAVAQTQDGVTYRSEPVRVLVYDPEARHAGPFLGEAAKIPGFLELEKFDHGGDGVGWSGGTATNGPRADSGMLLFPLGERGWIMWAKAGNRLRYTVQVAEAGRYRPVLDAANRGREQGAKRLHLTCLDTGQTVSFAVTPTGSNVDWIGFATAALDLPAGEVKLELHVEDGDINIDTIRFD